MIAAPYRWIAAMPPTFCSAAKPCFNAAMPKNGTVPSSNRSHGRGISTWNRSWTTRGTQCEHVREGRDGC